jgi:hypothetical protein
MRRHPKVCPMAAAGKVRGSIWWLLLLPASSFQNGSIHAPRCAALRCASSERPWPNFPSKTPPSRRPGGWLPWAGERDVDLKLLSGEPDSSSRLTRGAAPSPRSGILSSKAMDRTIRAGIAAWVAWRAWVARECCNLHPWRGTPALATLVPSGAQLQAGARRHKFVTCVSLRLLLPLLWRLDRQTAAAAVAVAAATNCCTARPSVHPRPDSDPDPNPRPRLKPALRTGWLAAGC